MTVFKITVLFFALGLLGCGQEGPLYMPTDKPPITEAPIKKSIKTESVIPQKTDPAPKTPPTFIKE
ncbi:MAG: lipoprotein [Methylococcales bacterium]|nr:lipoprotein [Methylococcales bacterium]